MALTEEQQDEVDKLKRLVGDVDLDDDDLYDYVQEAGSTNRAAASVWRYKAAHAADLIDVKEGSSSRPLSQLRSSYSAMADVYAKLADDESPSASSATRIGTVGR